MSVYVSSREHVIAVLEEGRKNRATSATNMNAKSSRSHCLLLAVITQRDPATGVSKRGKMFIVDLAGSERISKTGVTDGSRLEEAKNINRSLTTLGMVIKVGGYGVGGGS